MLHHSPLPRPVLDAIFSARNFAQKTGSKKIEPSHILAAINSIGGETTDSASGDIALSAASKLVVKRAITAAGDRHAVTIDHLRTAAVHSI